MIINVHELVSIRRDIWEKVNMYIFTIVGDKNTVEKICSLLVRSRTSLCVLFCAIYFFKKVKRRFADFVRRLDLMVKCDVTRYLVKKKKEVLCVAVGDDYNLFTVSLMVSCKNLLDLVYTNKCWAEVCGMGVKKLNAYERCVLEVLDYRTGISVDFFAGIIDDFEKLFEDVTFDDGKKRKKDSALQSLWNCLGVKLNCLNF